MTEVGLETQVAKTNDPCCLASQEQEAWWFLVSASSRSMCHHLGWMAQGMITQALGKMLYHP